MTYRTHTKTVIDMAFMAIANDHTLRHASLLEVGSIAGLIDFIYIFTQIKVTNKGIEKLRPKLWFPLKAIKFNQNSYESLNSFGLKYDNREVLK